MQVTSARAVEFQAPGDLHAPFGLRSLARRVCSNGYRLWNFAIFCSRNGTERTTFRVVEQEGATLRADTYHWSVLRCGSPVERTNHSTRDSRPRPTGSLLVWPIRQHQPGGGILSRV